MTKTKLWATAVCLGVMALSGGRLWAADLEQQRAVDLKAKMKSEGWKQISKGVFERRNGTRVEHLGYGPEGLSWTIGELSRQVETLTQEYESYPSDDLANVIEGLSGKLALAKQELKNMAKGLSSATAPVTAGSCSSICYSATADAYHLTSTQGVGAVAEAKFNSSCGYSGETYAYAYARATLNGTTTTVTQSDPDSGTSIVSYATATVNGGSITGTSCYSSANSYAQSTALGISYSTSDVNDGTCPTVPIPTPTITGTTYEYFYGNAPCRTKTWGVSISGGTSPFTYVWKYNGTAVGTGSTYSRSVCRFNASFTLDVQVTDVNGFSGTDNHSVTVEYEPAETCNPICQ